MNEQNKQYLVIELNQPALPSRDNETFKEQVALLVMAIIGMAGAVTIFGIAAPYAPLIGIVPFCSLLAVFVYRARKARHTAAHQSTEVVK